MVKRSKSECFLLLADPNKRMSVLQDILMDVNIRVPLRMIPTTPEFAEVARRNKNSRFFKKFGISNDKYGLNLPNEFDRVTPVKLHGKRKIKPDILFERLSNSLLETNQVTDCEKLVSLVNRVDFRIIKYIIHNMNIEIPSSLTFQDPVSIILYLSLNIKTNPASNTPTIQLLQNIERMKTQSIQKYILLPPTLSGITAYLRSSIANITVAHNTLIRIKSKLPNDLPTLCFSGILEYNSKIFKNSHVLTISNDTEFDYKAFTSLLNHKAFRKHIYNRWINEKFIEEMAQFCNRGDYTYYFTQKGMETNNQAKQKPPRDFQVYEFFVEPFTERTALLASQYLEKHGATPPICMYVQNNSDALISSTFTAPSADHVSHTRLLEILLAGSTPDQKMKMWQGLKKNGRGVLRQIYTAFGSTPEESPEPVLYGLLSKEYNFTPKEASQYINTGWEEELTAFFNTVPLKDSIGLADDWTYWFFSDVFTTDSLEAASEEQILQILKFAEQAMMSLREINRKKTALLYDRLFSLDKPEIKRVIYENLPESLKFVFVKRHSEYIDDYCDQLLDSLQSPTQSNGLYLLWNISQIYELKHSVDFNLFISLFNSLFNTHGHRTPDRADGNFFVEDHPIQSFFTISFVFRDNLKYYTAEYFEMLCNAINESISKKEATEMVQVDKAQFHDLIESISALTNPANGAGPERITLCSSRMFDSEYNLLGQLFMIRFILKTILSDKYTLFILFPYIKKLLHGDTTPIKILILAFMDSSLLVKEHASEFIGVVIPLLSGTNPALSRLSREVLKRISIDSPEVERILPDLIEACSDRSFVPSFFSSFRSLVFTNYLCLISLSLVLQVLLDNIGEFTDDVLEILSKLPHITSDKDKYRVNPVIFSRLVKFTAANQYLCSKVKGVAAIFAQCSSFEDYLPLINSASTLQLGEFMTEMLRIRDSSDINRRVISHIVHNNPVPALIASVCKLPEFDELLSEFIPLIKSLFLSNKPSERTASERAIEHVLNTHDMKTDTETSKLADELRVFINTCSILANHTVRLSCLKLISYLPAIYILRSDKHTLVRTDAYERWKVLVSHTNKALRACYHEILDFCLLMGHSAHGLAMDAVVTELVNKHPEWIEEYIENPIEQTEMMKGIIKVAKEVFNVEPVSHKQIYEYILVCAVNNGKMIEQAIQFHIKHGSTSIFKRFCNDKDYKEQLIQETPSEFIVKVIDELISEGVDSYNNEFIDDNESDIPEKNMNDKATVDKRVGKKKTKKVVDKSREVYWKVKNASMVNKEKSVEANIVDNLAWDAYKEKKELIFIEYMSVHNKLRILKDNTALGEESEKVCRKVINSLSSSRECEVFLLTAPIFQVAYYLDGVRIDCGKLGNLFERIFEEYTEVEKYITPENMKYIKGCSLRKVKEYDRMVELLIMDESKEAFGKMVEIASAGKVPERLAQEVLGYFLYAFLMKSRRVPARDAISAIYSTGGDFGYFASIIERNVLPYKHADN